MTALLNGSSISSYVLKDGIAVLAINSPPVNALGHDVRVALEEGVGRAIGDVGARALIIRCDGRTFFAGADIKEIDGEVRQPDLNNIFAAIENSEKPVIAAIHGTALGGGFELALACHYRIAAVGAKVGLPEVSLGLLPAAGGTQRAPRIAGVAQALDFLVGGAPIGAKAAIAAGLIDRVANGDLTADAITFARELIDAGAPYRRIRDMTPDLDPKTAATVIEDYVRKNARNFRGFKAPGHIVKAIEAAVSLPFDEGLKRERELFNELARSSESKAQRHIFFAERAAGKVPSLAKETRPVEIASVAVIGAGTMGSGIATAFLNIGMPVALADHKHSAVERAANGIAETFAHLVAKGCISAEEGKRRTGALRPTTDLASAVSEADLVIETIYEDLELKKAIFSQIDAAAKTGAILASSTSFLDLDAIATATKRPDRVIGLHFFAPANISRLLEVVRGAETSDAVIATGMALGRKLGKIAVLSKVCDGFIANRVMVTRTSAAEALVLEGPLPWDVDRVMKGFGFPMGPFEMIDLVGLDVSGWDQRNSAGRGLQKVLCDMGRYGQNKGAGYYDYDALQVAVPSAVAERAILALAASTGTARRAFTNNEIVERLLYPVVNESAKLLEEGIVLRASDIDVALVTGYAWPAWTGGPLFWADSLGLSRIVATLDATIGADRVSPLLRQYAADDGRRERSGIASAAIT